MIRVIFTNDNTSIECVGFKDATQDGITIITANGREQRFNEPYNVEMYKPYTEYEMEHINHNLEEANNKFDEQLLRDFLKMRIKKCEDKIEEWGDFKYQFPTMLQAVEARLTAYRDVLDKLDKPERMKEQVAMG